MWWCDCEKTRETQKEKEEEEVLVGLLPVVQARASLLGCLTTQPTHSTNAVAFSMLTSSSCTLPTHPHTNRRWILPLQPRAAAKSEASGPPPFKQQDPLLLLYSIHTPPQLPCHHQEEQLRHHLFSSSFSSSSPFMPFSSSLPACPSLARPQPQPLPPGSCSPPLPFPPLLRPPLSSKAQ